MSQSVKKLLQINKAMVLGAGYNDIQALFFLRK